MMGEFDGAYGEPEEATWQVFQSVDFTESSIGRRVRTTDERR
jgi:hypothetical protein